MYVGTCHAGIDPVLLLARRELSLLQRRDGGHPPQEIQDAVLVPVASIKALDHLPGGQRRRLLRRGRRHIEHSRDLSLIHI